MSTAYIDAFTVQSYGYSGENIACFTSLREPIDRLVSLYYYMLDKQGLPITRLLQDMSPEEVIAEMEKEWPLMRQTPLLSQIGTCPAVVVREGSKTPVLTMTSAAATCFYAVCGIYWKPPSLLLRPRTRLYAVAFSFLWQCVSTLYRVPCGVLVCPLVHAMSREM